MESRYSTVLYTCPIHKSIYIRHIHVIITNVSFHVRTLTPEGGRIRNDGAVSIYKHTGPLEGAGCPCNSERFDRLATAMMNAGEFY